jgi:hypothetical protein
MRRMVLYLVLAAALPLAILAAVLPANGYKVQGIAARDCDGPISVFVVALPALLIYGLATILLYRNRSGRFHRIGALCCLLITLAIGWNLTDAIREAHGDDAMEACA